MLAQIEPILRFSIYSHRHSLKWVSLTDGYSHQMCIKVLSCQQTQFIIFLKAWLELKLSIKTQRTHTRQKFTKACILSPKGANSRYFRKVKNWENGDYFFLINRHIKICWIGPCTLGSFGGLSCREYDCFHACTFGIHIILWLFNPILYIKICFKASPQV